MSDYHKLLYTLEKVKVACSDEYGVYYSWSDDDENETLCQLERDGLIRRYSQETNGQILWKLK